MVGKRVIRFWVELEFIADSDPTHPTKSLKSLRQFKAIGFCNWRRANKKAPYCIFTLRARP